MNKKIKHLNLVAFFVGIMVSVTSCVPSVNDKSIENINAALVPGNQNTNSDSSSVIPVEAGIQEDGEDIDISNWKTYRNEEYEFEFKYPEGWEVIQLEDSKAGVGIQSSAFNPSLINSLADIFVRSDLNFKNVSILDYIDSFNDSSRFWPDEYSYIEYHIGENEALSFENIEERTINRKVIFLKNDNSFITAQYFFDDLDVLVKKNFDKLVETIKFR